MPQTIEKEEDKLECTFKPDLGKTKERNQCVQSKYLKFKQKEVQREVMVPTMTPSQVVETRAIIPEKKISLKAYLNCSQPVTVAPQTHKFVMHSPRNQASIPFQQY